MMGSRSLTPTDCLLLTKGRKHLYGTERLGCHHHLSDQHRPTNKRQDNNHCFQRWTVKHTASPARLLLKPFTESNQAFGSKFAGRGLSKIKPLRNIVTFRMWAILWNGWPCLFKKAEQAMVGLGGIKRNLRDITIKFNGWFLTTSLGGNRYKGTVWDKLEHLNVGNQWY